MRPLPGTRPGRRPGVALQLCFIMPAISLVVCVLGERELLGRLLKEAAGCYDDLVVIHDGPEKDNVGDLVRAHGGCFYEHRFSGGEEGLWAFAWGKAACNWILRLDADEFPSREMKEWLKEFRHSPEPNPETSGFTCIWPLWDGKQAVTERWPEGRIFLFNRQSVRHFGLQEQTPIPDGVFRPLPLVLHHQPSRKSYGLHNVLCRPTAYRWRRTLINGLLGKPTDLPCWRWTDPAWPEHWEILRRQPLRTGFKRLLMFPIRTARAQWRAERRVTFGNALNSAVFHFLVCLGYWWRTRVKRS
jgi:hypothetical protein